MATEALKSSDLLAALQRGLSMHWEEIAFVEKPGSAWNSPGDTLRDRDGRYCSVRQLGKQGKPPPCYEGGFHMFGLSLAHWLVILSALISAAGSYAYIRNTLAGKTKPNRVSWSLWALAPLIGAGAALSSDADLWTTLRIFLAGLMPLIVLLASFANTQSYWKVTTFDLLCGALSLTALMFWVLVDSPRTAILLATCADGFASLPTLIKSWRYPETETGITYMASLVSVLLVIPSIPVWNIENSAFQVYLLLADTLFLITLYRRRLEFWK
jgi:hypothetical protein